MIGSYTYLDALMDAFKNQPHVGFCWDCGHEGCFTPGRRYMPLFGDRLICTHIHDNLGTVDMHVPPFMGSIDWENVMKALADIDYDGNLTFEADNTLKRCPDFFRKSINR